MALRRLIENHDWFTFHFQKTKQIIKVTQQENRTRWLVEIDGEEVLHPDYDFSKQGDVIRFVMDQAEKAKYHRWYDWKKLYLQAKDMLAEAKEEGLVSFESFDGDEIDLYYVDGKWMVTVNHDRMDSYDDVIDFSDLSQVSYAIESYLPTNKQMKELVNKIVEKTYTEQYEVFHNEELLNEIDIAFGTDERDDLVHNLVERLRNDERVDLLDDQSSIDTENGIIMDYHYRFALVPKGRYRKVQDAIDWSETFRQLMGRKEICEYIKKSDGSLSQIISRSDKEDSNVKNRFPKPAIYISGRPIWFKVEIDKWFSRYIEGWMVQERLQSIRDHYVATVKEDHFAQADDDTLMESIIIEWHDTHDDITQFHYDALKKLKSLLKEDPRLVMWEEGERYIHEGEFYTVDTPVVILKDQYSNPKEAEQAYSDDFFI